MKFIIVGHARSGKDTVAEVLRDEYGAKFQSSSVFCLKTAVMPALADIGYKYASAEDCMHYRETVPNWRAIWHEAIANYNTPDKTKLGRELFKEYDIYVGLRSNTEFNALRNEGVFDYAIWVDAQDRGVLPEPRSSNKIEPWMADFVLDNNYTVDALKHNTRQLMKRLNAGMTGLIKRKLMIFIEQSKEPVAIPTLWNMVSCDMTKTEFTEALTSLHNEKKVCVFYVKDVGQCVLAARTT